MASSDESTDYISDSEAIETEIEYDLEVEGSPHSFERSRRRKPTEIETNKVYADEPLAGDEWLAHYEEEMKVERKLVKKLRKRLRRTQKVLDW